jgi:hypothetical protein
MFLTKAMKILHNIINFHCYVLSFEKALNQFIKQYKRYSGNRIQV